MAEKILKVGDEVLWRGAWGSELVKKAIVTVLEIVKRQGVVVLDNGHWAYGYQVYRIK